MPRARRGLLAIALLCGGAPATAAEPPPPPGPRPGDNLAAVTLELPPAQAERLGRYVDLAPGSPYDASAVHRAVELLFSTGEFEDVLVEARPGRDGWTLTLRPRPAPRLRDVRVEGDRVLSAAAARRAARLSPGEALWPARLERASRDVAVALAADGWLEARVQARAERAEEGATVVFALSSGARARVSAVAVEGAGPLLQQSLLPLARPRAGRAFRRDEARRAAERMRAHLRDLGRWRAEVEPRESYDPRTAGVDLRFLVDLGPVTLLEFAGARLPGGLRGSLLDKLREGGLATDVLEEVSERIEAALREAGHREPTVARREEPRPGGVTVVYQIEPGPLARVYRVRVTGADDVDPPLSVVLRTRVDQPLRESDLDEDERTLRAALHERGHLAARVETDVPEGGGLLPVTFRLRPGPRTLLARVELKPASAEGVVLPRLPLEAGRPYRVADVATAATLLAAAWRNAGYLRAEVEPQVVLSEDRGEAQVELRVAPGARTLVDRLVVTGLEHTREQVVRRELELEEGQPLGLARVLATQRRLGALSIFRRVSVRELNPEALERRSVVVALEEARRTTVAYGVGYAERELLRGSLEVTRRNLFGLDRSLTAFGRASFRGSRLLASYREPWLLGRRQELFVTAFREREDRVSFDFTRAGGLVQSALGLGTHTSLILRLQYQRTKLFDVDVPLSEIDRQFRSSTSSGPSVSLIHDSRPDPLDPQDGLFFGADLQLSQRFLGGDRFVKGFFQFSGYERVAPRLLLAVNTRLGLARTFGQEAPTRLPLADRFFAGGDYSLRGFATDSAGPREPSEDAARLVPVGGNALLLAGAELRVDATRFVSVALFGDAGNVFPVVGDVRLAELRYTAGVGLRYKSALGPLRVDWGYKLDRRPGESASELHVTVGHAF